MAEALRPASFPSPNIVPDSDELFAELWEARMLYPYASAERLRQYILERCREWEVSLKRVKKMIKDHPYLQTIPLGSSSPASDDGHDQPVEVALQRTMDKEALRVLLYELTKRENTFLDYVHDEAARMWMPTRCEFVMMAAGIKPACLIWSGVSDDGDDPQYGSDFAKVCLWMTTVWIRTVESLKNLPHIDARLKTWLTSVSDNTIEHSITTGWLDHGRFKIPYPDSYFSGRLVYSSSTSPLAHRMVVDRVFHHPEEYPRPPTHPKSPFVPQPGQLILSENALAASLGYPVALPSTRGLSAFNASAYVYEDFRDGRSLLTSFMFAAPFDAERVIRWFHDFVELIQGVMVGTLNLVVLPCPDGRPMEHVGLNQLQRVTFVTGGGREWNVFPYEPLSLTMAEAYQGLRDELAPKFGLNHFSMTKKARSFMFIPWNTTQDECELRCESNGRWQILEPKHDKRRGRSRRKSVK